MTRAEILDKTKAVITQDRNDSYGNPEDSFAIIAHMWSAYLGVLIKETDVAAMMVLFKVARMAFADKEDNWIDACGYAAIGAELMSAELELGNIVRRTNEATVTMP